MAITTLGLRLVIAATLIVIGCGSAIDEATGPVTAATVQQLEDVLHRRAAAIGKADRSAFLATLDPTRATFRRIQLADFDQPTVRGALGSSFKITGAERYGAYLRGWVEETIEGNSLPGAFAGGVAYVRRYFRKEGQSWVLTEPTAAESGLQKQRTIGDLTVEYWGMDDDVGDALVAAGDEARRFAVSKSPTGQRLVWTVTFLPTAELAGPNFDGYQISGGNSLRDFMYPGVWAFAQSRTSVSALTTYLLRHEALFRMRNVVVPGAEARLVGDTWLRDGWTSHEAGLDYTVTLKQACVGIPVPTLKELSAGAPLSSQPGITAEAFGRYYAFAQSMVDYLYERYGGDAYWRLMQAFVENASSAVNMPRVLSVSPDNFYSSWLTWLKKKYCY